MFKKGRFPDRPRLESRRSFVAQLISSSHDVMAVDPDSLPVPRCPMSWFPDVIGAAYIIARPVAVVGPIADCHSDGTRITPVIRSAIIRTGAMIGTIAGITSVVVCAARDTKRGAKYNKQHEVPHFHFHLYEYSESANDLRVWRHRKFYTCPTI